MKWWFAIYVLLSAATQSRADLSVGDKPQLAFKAVDGQPIDLKSLHGNLVVVDFWAVSDLSKNIEQRLAGLAKQHADDGVVFIGICCDRDLAHASDFMKENGITWPRYYDGGKWNSRPNSEWGMHHIGCALLDDGGSVLWVGSGLQLDHALSAALIQHPPARVDPVLLTTAATTLDSVETSLKSGDELAAIKTFATVPQDARKNKVFATRLADLETRMKQVLADQFSQADALAQQKQFIACENHLLKLMAALQNTPAARDAQKRLNDLHDNSEAKAQFDRAHRDKEADEALAVVRKYRDSGQDEQAYPRAKGLLEDFADSPAASEAAIIVATYEKDGAFIKRMKQAAIDAKARPIMSLAKNYLAAGRKDLAREKFQDVIKQFPDTDWANDAKNELAEMDK